MIIYPAVDIRDGRCVRLRKGDPQLGTDFGDPVTAALRWKDEGAQWLHVVDLDGAFSGNGKNAPIIERIVSETRLPVEMGGGIRTKKAIEASFDQLGVERVILGTVAIEFPELVKWAVNAYGDRIAVGIDARDGKVAVHGWLEDSGMDPMSLAVRLHTLGVQTFIFTNISHDGMMKGPDLEMTGQLVDKTGADVIGSGGISSLADIEAMKKTGAKGCIVGRALFDGAFSLGQAIETAGGHVC